jgi:hypothetical protein
MTSIGPSPRGSVLAAGVTAAVLMAVLSVGTANSMRHAKVATRYIDTNARHQAAVALMSLTTLWWALIRTDPATQVPDPQLSKPRMRAALPYKNFGHTSSLRSTFGSSRKIRSSDKPIGK